MKLRFWKTTDELIDLILLNEKLINNSLLLFSEDKGENVLKEAIRMRVSARRLSQLTRKRLRLMSRLYSTKQYISLLKNN